MQKKALYVMRRALLLFGGASFLCGCVRDNRDDCLFPLRLQFSYTYNREGRDLFSAEVEQVRLYLFDSRSGELKASAVARSKDLGPDNTFTWNVAPGSYHAVAWGCSEGERYRVLSSERFPQSRLSVQTLSDGSSVEQKPEHLWYEIGRGLTVTGELQAPHPMDLHKLSNDVRVEVSGLRDEQFPRLSCTISASNGTYDFEGRTRDENPVVWLPESSRESDRSIHKFTVLRLAEGDDSRLHVEVLPDGSGRGLSGVIFDGSLSELLSANPAVDLDLDDEFVIRLESQLQPDGNFSVSIFVNDWHVIDMNGGLG